MGRGRLPDVPVLMAEYTRQTCRSGSETQRADAIGKSSGGHGTAVCRLKCHHDPRTGKECGGDSWCGGRDFVWRAGVGAVGPTESRGRRGCVVVVTDRSAQPARLTVEKRPR